MSNWRVLVHPEWSFSYANDASIDSLHDAAAVAQWWAKSNRDSIQSRFESQRRFDSNIARFDSSRPTMRFDTDSIQILTIRFKRHAILTEISKSWLKLNRGLLILSTHYSVRSFTELYANLMHK